MSTEQPAVRGPLQTVDRALMVLLSFTARRTEWGVMELARELDLDKSSAQRLLAALATRGFLYVDPVTHRYRLGAAVWRIASTWERRGGMAALVTPPLTELADAATRSAVFTLADGAYLRCVAAVDGGGVAPMRDHPLIGEVYPAHAGATSRAYFAFLPKGQRQSLMYRGPLARFSELTVLDPDAIESEMAKTSDAGWAYSEGEYDVNTRAIAAPVFLGGHPIGSVSLGERKRDHDDDIRDYVDDLLITTKRIGGLLSSASLARPGASE